MNLPTVAIGGVPDPLPEGLAVLDVREPVEWAYGHIDGAVHVPLMELPQRLDEVGRRADAGGLQGRCAARRRRSATSGSRATTRSTSTAACWTGRRPVAPW